MKVVIICILLGLSLASTLDESRPLITKEYLSTLKQKSSFDVMDFESHPFANWSVKDIKNKLGLMRQTMTKREIFYGDVTGLPEEFDSRTQWPNCIHKIRDQQSCGSCWAFAASEVLSDRFCIASNEKTNVVLSPQDMVSCDTDFNLGCDGGYLDKSWDYLQETGIVSDECLPYTSGRGDSGVCPFTRGKPGKCKKGTFQKYQVSQYDHHDSIAEAKAALVNGGPLEAGFDVYDDFMSYSSGIYVRHSNYLLGGHAVKIVGWGKSDDGTEYWIVANSWNTGWGENGFFRIAFNQCNFESELYSGTPIVKAEHTHDFDLFLN